MKSFVMNIWLTTWKKLYGDKVVDSLVSEFNIETSKLIIPTNDVPDDLVVRVSKSLAQKVGKLTKNFGRRQVIKTFGLSTLSIQAILEKKESCRF